MAAAEYSARGGGRLASHGSPLCCGCTPALSTATSTLKRPYRLGASRRDNRLTWHAVVCPAPRCTARSNPCWLCWELWILEP